MNSKCKVLVVDDIHENIELVADMLKGLDVEIQKADGGAKAIELVDSYQPNIILLDLMMPQVNGWDVIKYVRASYDKSEMAIIVVSLLNNKDNIDDCYEMGVNDYICKPIIKADLVSSVETHKENIVEPTPKASPTMVALHNNNKAIFGM